MLMYQLKASRHYVLAITTEYIFFLRYARDLGFGAKNLGTIPLNQVSFPFQIMQGRIVIGMNS